MIRTKHLFIFAAFLLLVVSTGGVGTLAVKTAAGALSQSASAILSTPDDDYTATVAETSLEETASFIERIRDSYVPANRESEERSTPTVIDTPVPSTVSTTPDLSSTTTIEEGNAATNTVDSESSYEYGTTTSHDPVSE